MAESQPEKLEVKASHVSVDKSGHVTITDPKVAELLRRKAGAGVGPLRDDGVSVEVSVTVRF